MFATSSRDRLIRAVCVSFLLAAASWGAERADWIWTARYVVTMDAARRVIEDGAVAVQGERIAAVGRKAEIEKQYRARHRLEIADGAILPGLINAHTHAPMSLMRGIADDVRLQEWLEKYIFPAEARNVDAEYVRWGTRLACLEMMLAGVTTYAEMYYFEEVIAEATREAGLRGVLGETIINFPAPDARTPEEALKYTEAYVRRFRNDPLIVPAVAPHALYTNTPETLRACRALADRYGVPLMLHLAETKREVEDTRAKYGMSPIRFLDSLGIFQRRTLAAHVVWPDEEDLALLKARGVGIAHCASSNAKLASGIAPVVKMLSLELPVGLGTDGPAGSNNDFELLEEMDLAAKLQKVTTGDPQALPAHRALEMGTILGARALGLEAQIGSLEAGKRADLITLRLDRPNAVPLYHLDSQIVYTVKSCDVRDVMVNGKLLVRNRRPLTLNVPQVLKMAETYAAKVRASLR